MSATDAQPLHILLVEDNPIHASLICRHLAKVARELVTVCHVNRLSGALDVLAQGEIDALLLDLGLPDSPLDKTLARVIEQRSDLPIVVLTSLNDLEFAAQAIGQGAQDYLVKTDLSGQLLLRSVRYAIERKKAQEKLATYAAELERSNEHLRSFAHTVAHEVKSPLNVVAACLNLLEGNHATGFDRETQAIVQDAHGAIRGMMELVNELLDFARVDSGGQGVDEVDLEAVFYQVYVLLRSALKKAGATCTHDPMPSVRGNEVQLRQLLQNLIGNAIKYRSARPLVIHIGVEEDCGANETPAYWTFHIQDNGIGIAPEHQQRIFEAFVRLHHSPDVSGTGIGLAFCKRIVEHHGGQIWVESVPGQGSIFSFTLPATTT